MKKESGSIAFACALGAFVGALCALEIQSRFVLGSYLWIFGAFFGGLVAWCAVDFKQFCSGVARSYRVSAEKIANAYCGAKDWRWEPNKAWWKAFATMLAGMGAVMLTLVLLLTTTDHYGHRLSGIMFFVSGIMWFLSFLVAILWGMAILVLFCMLGSKSIPLVEMREDFWLLFKLGNPVVVPFYLLYKLSEYFWDNRHKHTEIIVRYAENVISVVAFIGRETGRFFVRAFIYIHSERRTICFVDATLGAIAGFFLGSATLGAMFGAVFGIANYEIVSIRWLKIVPA